ncbi:hypothetical protein T484DRAFT_1768662 [Baffinella frigidus]|nr:hypothetical protein T484DRAFT_1768662 [Cryptophyta sp. CCMP2293]
MCLADLKNAILTKCDCTKMDASGADFSDVNMEECKLDGANLQDAVCASSCWVHQA